MARSASVGGRLELEAADPHPGAGRVRLRRRNEVDRRGEVLLGGIDVEAGAGGCSCSHEGRRREGSIAAGPGVDGDRRAHPARGGRPGRGPPHGGREHAVERSSPPRAARGRSRGGTRTPRHARRSHRPEPHPRGGSAPRQRGISSRWATRSRSHSTPSAAAIRSVAPTPSPSESTRATTASRSVAGELRGPGQRLRRQRGQQQRVTAAPYVATRRRARRRPARRRPRGRADRRGHGAWLRDPWPRPGSVVTTMTVRRAAPPGEGKPRPSAGPGQVQILDDQHRRQIASDTVERRREGGKRSRPRRPPHRPPRSPPRSSIGPSRGASKAASAPTTAAARSAPIARRWSASASPTGCSGRSRPSSSQRPRSTTAWRRPRDHASTSVVLPIPASPSTTTSAAVPARAAARAASRTASSASRPTIPTPATSPTGRPAPVGTLAVSHRRRPGQRA